MPPLGPTETTMKAIPLSALALALAIVQGSALARTAPERTWNTSAELGAIATSGNTVGASITSKIDAKQELEDWSNEYVASAYFKEDETHNAAGQTVRERSAERYSLSAKAAYKLLEEGEKMFVLGSHVGDRFGAYTSFSTFGVGHGSRWYTDEDKTVDVEIGPGYFSGRRAGGEEENGFTIRGAAALKWQVSDAAVFTQNLSVERGTSNVHSLAESALRTKINSTMQMKAAFSVRNDTDVPADKKNTDTQTSVTLVYSF